MACPDRPSAASGLGGQGNGGSGPFTVRYQQEMAAQQQQQQ